MWFLPCYDFFIYSTLPGASTSHQAGGAYILVEPTAPPETPAYTEQVVPSNDVNTAGQIVILAALH